MKLKSVILMPMLAALIVSCAPAEIELVDNLPMPGSDRDAHGSIGSAGYSWSEVRADFIRVWEDGVALVDAQDAAATSSAYLIASADNSKQELFLPDGSQFQLKMTENGVWKDAEGIYFVEMAQGRIRVTDCYETLLFKGASANVELPADENKAGEGAIREFGRVVSSEDSVYPMFNMNMEFPERGTQESFSFNIMEVDFEESALAGLVGRYATIYYTLDLDANLVDLKLGGASIFECGFDVPDAKSVTGVLSGAGAPTMSDLPGEFVITGADGTDARFEYNIPDSMAAANGKTVTATYVTRTRNTITKILPAAE